MKDFYKIIKTLKTKDVVVAILIVALPFLFYLYKLAPNTPVWETGWFVLDSDDLENARYYLWLICTKLLLVFSLSIWFITCKHWWRYVILVPLIIELFKYRSVYNNIGLVIDEVEYLNSLPFTIPVVILIIFISKKINYYSKYLDLHNEINIEIENLLNEFETNNKAMVIEEFRKLKESKSSLSTEDYKIKLLRLRQQLINL